MAYTTFNVPSYSGDNSGNDVPFRLWGSTLSRAIENVGMVRTADTGQIDWDTITADGSTLNSPVGYEVWRFDDALQTTHPLVWKLYYGKGSGANGVSPRLWVEVGKGSDGDGNLTGILIPRTRLGNSGSGAATYNTNPSMSVVATCANRACLAVILWHDPAPTQAMPAFILERSRDATGAPTGIGVSLAAQVGGAQSGVTTAGAPNIFISAAYDSGAQASGVIPVVIPETVADVQIGASSSLASGVIGPVLPWTAWAPGIAPWQPLATLSYMGGDATPGAVVTVRTHGQDRTYKVLPLNNAVNGWGVAIPGSDNPGTNVTSRRAVGLMVLWEDD